MSKDFETEYQYMLDSQDEVLEAIEARHGPKGKEYRKIAVETSYSYSILRALAESGAFYQPELTEYLVYAASCVLTVGVQLAAILLGKGLSDKTLFDEFNSDISSLSRFQVIHVRRPENGDED